MNQVHQIDHPANTAQLVAAGIRGYRDAWQGITERPVLHAWGPQEWEAWEAGRRQAEVEIGAASAVVERQLLREYPEISMVETIWDDAVPLLRAHCHPGGIDVPCRLSIPGPHTSRSSCQLMVKSVQTAQNTRN